MDTITFRLPIELKEQFQIKLIKEKKNMSNVLLDLVKEYVKNDK
ncbi:MAG: hypothetical protein ACI3T9_06015 [Romboutsia timonensis]